LDVSRALNRAASRLHDHKPPEVLFERLVGNNADLLTLEFFLRASTRGRKADPTSVTYVVLAPPAREQIALRPDTNERRVCLDGG
jgi:hypothetical protein